MSQVIRLQAQNKELEATAKMYEDVHSSNAQLRELYAQVLRSFSSCRLYTARKPACMCLLMEGRPIMLIEHMTHLYLLLWPAATCNGLLPAIACCLTLPVGCHEFWTTLPQ